MILHYVIIGLGTLAGIYLNYRFNRQIVAYQILGSITIAFVGALACLIVSGALYFLDYSTFVLYTALSGVLIMSVYIGVSLVLRHKKLILARAETKRPAKMALSPAPEGSRVAQFHAAPVLEPEVPPVQSAGAVVPAQEEDLGLVGVGVLEEALPVQDEAQMPPEQDFDLLAAQIVDAAIASMGSAAVEEESAEPVEEAAEEEGEEAITERIEEVAEEAEAAEPTEETAEEEPSEEVEEEAAEAVEEAVEEADESTEAEIAEEAAEEEVIKEEIAEPAAEAAQEEEEIEDFEPVAACIEAEEEEAEEPSEEAVEDEADETAEIVPEETEAEPEEEITEEAGEEAPAEAEAVGGEEDAFEPVELAVTAQEADESSEETVVQEKEAEAAEEIPAPQSRADALLAKARMLTAQSHYRIALDLLDACAREAGDDEARKSADILMAQCLVGMEDYAGAKEKTFEILKKGYALNPDDKLALKTILTRLSDRASDV